MNRGEPPAGEPAPARSNPPPPVVVSLAIVTDGDCVLVTRRLPGEHLEGLWEFPGGKLREGERADEAARRELFEEAGLDIDARSFEPLTFVHHDYGDRRVLLFAFTARRPRQDAGEDAAGDGRERRWVPWNQLSDLAMPPANGALLSRLRYGPARPGGA